MYKSVFVLLLYFLLLITSSCSEDTLAGKNTSLEAIDMINLEYGSESLQKYDIYLPQNRSLEAKVLIVIHGGGWKAGNKSEMAGFKDFIRDQLPAIAVVNMNTQSTKRITCKLIRVFPIWQNGAIVF